MSEQKGHETDKVKPGGRTVRSKKLSGKVRPRPICGIVMPISEIDGCSEAHWKDVRRIIATAIERAGFEPNLVSDSLDSGVIQARIVQNLFDNELVVCDLSGRNPNVMFELGMRLTFDKPTVIIRDDKTPSAFDVGPIEYLPYRRDLRYRDTQRFISQLAEKLKWTKTKADDDPNYSTYLKHFAKIEVRGLQTESVPLSDFVVRKLEELATAIANLEKAGRRTRASGHRNEPSNSATVILPILAENEIPADAKYSDMPKSVLIEMGRALRKNGLSFALAAVYDAILEAQEARRYWDKLRGLQDLAALS